MVKCCQRWIKKNMRDLRVYETVSKIPKNAECYNTTIGI